MSDEKSRTLLQIVPPQDSSPAHEKSIALHAAKKRKKTNPIRSPRAIALQEAGKDFWTRTTNKFARSAVSPDAKALLGFLKTFDSVGRDSFTSSSQLISPLNAREIADQLGIGRNILARAKYELERRMIICVRRGHSRGKNCPPDRDSFVILPEKTWNLN